MSRTAKDQLIIGVGSHVVCIDSQRGDELWRTKLRSSSFATVSHVGKHVYAGASGELFCLDARTGEILWHNKLKGLGMGVITFASDSSAAALASAVQAQQTAAVVAATV